MSYRFAILTCLLAASAACSQQNEPVRDPTDATAAMPASEPGMTPASTEGTARDTRAMGPEATSGDTSPTNAPSTIGQSDDARAPVTAGTTTTTDSTKSNPTQPAAAPAPDNTKANERDRSSAAVTPPDQRENESDLKITQHIRQAVMADDTLSFTAKNVKIITTGGKVTLRGPVKTDAERNAIEAAARKVAGVNQVDNQIEVKK